MPRTLAPAEHQVCVVACHPQKEVMGVGYEDGRVALVRITDGALRFRPGGPPVSALAWNAKGEDSETGVVNLA